MTGDQCAAGCRRMLLDSSMPIPRTLFATRSQSSKQSFWIPQTVRYQHNMTRTQEFPPTRNFPPSAAGSSSFFVFPGLTPESTATTRKLLEENDKKYDIFMSNRIFHNHFSHGLLTRYAFGAPPKMLEDSWKHDQKDLFPLDLLAKGRRASVVKRLPESITEATWDDSATLGVTDAYPLYLAFIHAEVDRIGPADTLKKYILSPQANFETRDNRPAPQMIHRFLSGVLHPMIHVGFGIEFNDRITLAEGIAQACVNGTSYSNLFDLEWLRSLSKSSSEPPKSGSKSLLQIYADLCADPTFKPKAYNPDELINDRVKNALADGKDTKLREMVIGWSLTDKELGDGPQGWKAKVQELDLLATLMACATTRRGYEKKVDFFLMHGLTSSMFSHAFMPLLNVPERRTFLATYVLTLLVVSLSRGRPNLDPSWLMEASAFPSPPTTNGKSGGPTISDPTDKETGNSWTDVIQSSLYDYDQHTPKAIRSLVHYATIHGHTPAGDFPGTVDDKGKELIPGLSAVDGTVFIRAAGLVMDVIGWCREGEKSGGWDGSALGYDEAWKDVKKRPVA